MKNHATLYPLATYRWQFHYTQGFAVATELIPYLQRLGISHLYSSPVLRARHGSTHGYDVVDPREVNPELGSESDFRNLVETLRRYGLGLLLDIVPNHMAASSENPYWQHVLAYGLSSPYAGWFDIDWRTPDPEMWGRVLAPVLGESLKKMILNEQLRIEWQLGRFVLKVYDQNWPIDPATVPRILRSGWPALETRLGKNAPVIRQLRNVARQLNTLPSVVRRVRGADQFDIAAAEELLATLAQAIDSSPSVRQWAEETAQNFGLGERGRRRMRNLVDAQPYRLVLWRKAARFMNYRRFFAINELVSVRQENPQVFQATHETILRWVKEGLIDGLRIDHIDGLRDPLDYLQQLQEAVSEARSKGPATPLWVEKILERDELLPEQWPVHGTTGYEFLNQAEALFVSPSGFRELEKWYQQRQRRPGSFFQAVSAGKKRILKDDLSPHIGRLADMLLQIADRRLQEMPEPVLAETGSFYSETAIPEITANESSDEEVASMKPSRLTKAAFVTALVEVIVALPIYRSYVDSATNELSAHDRFYLEQALATAREAGVAEPSALEFLQSVLLLEPREGLTEETLRSSITFLQKFQQYTGPAAAKGIEDTALYTYVPLVSLNEVGGQPDLPLESALHDFHVANAYRAKHLPHSMLCVTTHDTKRSADVRARLNVLSEIPLQWKQLVTHWLRTNRVARTKVNGSLAPDFNAEYLFYQSAVGLWPHAGQFNGPEQALTRENRESLRERLEQYMLKALREAKRHTNWASPNEQYESAIAAFIRHVIPEAPGLFEKELQTFVDQIAYAGYWNALARTLIQFTAPGFPDIYQGDEIWNFSLVDPDNRRPVDFARRNQLIDSLAMELETDRANLTTLWIELLQTPQDGRLKLLLIQTILHDRREYAEVFNRGSYLPLAIEGSRKEHVLAYYRRFEDQEMLVVAPRLTLSLVERPEEIPAGSKLWKNTSVVLPEDCRTLDWVNGLTNDTMSLTPVAGDSSLKIPLGRMLEHLPWGLFFGISQNKEPRMTKCEI